MTSKQIVGAAIVDNRVKPGQLLVARRSAPEALAGLWEFPGGKVEAGENHEDALHRELAEELGIHVELGAEIVAPDADAGWLLGNGARMRVWFAEISQGEPLPLEDHDELRWMDLSEHAPIMELAWIPADLPIVSELLRLACARNA